MTRRASTTDTYGQTLGVRLMQTLAERGLFIFTTDEVKDVAADLEIPTGYLPQLLSRLAASGWLVRLRRGLYAGTGRLRGETEVHPFAIATSLVSPAAISHWSALHHHGLSEQIPQSVSASTPKRIVTPSMRSGSDSPRADKHAWEVNGVRYEYVTTTAERFFGIEEVWVDEHFKIPIYDRERCLLDGFAAPRLFGSLSEVLGILEEHLDELDLEKLVDYGLRYGKASVAKRLGWALERAGAPRRVTAPLAELPMAGLRSLDPTRPLQGSPDARWMLVDNLTLGRALRKPPEDAAEKEEMHGRQGQENGAHSERKPAGNRH